MSSSGNKSEQIEILIVDDSATDRVIFQRYLKQNQSASYIFQEAESISEALKIIGSGKPDCILLDYDLPDGRGTEIIDRINDEWGKNWIPIVILSGVESIEIALEVIRRGAQDYLVKSRATAGDLVRAIDNAIDKARLYAEKDKDAEKIRASEARYRQLFNSIDEDFCVIEIIFNTAREAVDYRFLEINAAFEKQTGLTEVEGKLVSQLVPNLEKSWLKIYGEVALTGVPVRVDNRVENLNRWVDVYAFRFGDAAENQVAVIFNDISERRRAEEKISQSEERYRTLFNSIDEGFCTLEMLFDADGKPVDYRFLEMNPSFEKLTGLSAAEARGGRTARQLVPNLEEKWFEIYGRVALTGEPVRFVEGSDALNSWFDVYAARVGNAESRKVALIFNNITDRKRAEEERAEAYRQLEMERSRLSYIFEKAPAFVTVLRGEQHVFELVNPAYLRLIGHRDVSGKTIREALPDLVGQGYFELLDNVYRTGEPFIGRESAVELQYAPESPLEKRFVDFVFQPIFEADHSVSGIFVHGVDITEQVTARQAADNANRLKDEFLATLSHELRTPLNAIIGWTQISQTRVLSEAEMKKALAVIDRSARSQNQLIEDILDISRIITGKFRLDVRALDLVNVITAAVETVRPAAEAKGIRLQMLLDPQATNISGDSDRLQQVIWNLLSNAVKFTPKKGRIQIRLERVNSHVEITVSDTGKGIEPEFLPYVFDRFRQSDGSMTRRHGGLGLGLALVRQIVELHGGSVSVNSAGENQGAAFSVHLPLLPLRMDPSGALPRVHPEATEVHSGEEIKADLSDLKILIVDDEADSRDLLKTALEPHGAAIVTASSAQEALAAIKSEKFDVLISDIGMPEEDGFSLIGKIRKLPANQGGKTPAIALTAYARTEDRIKALQSGFQMHISKPISFKELVTIILSLAEKIENP